MPSVQVTLPNHHYDIKIGRGLLNEADRFLAPFLKRPMVTIITDENVARHWLMPLRQVLQKSGIKVVEIIIPAGETSKSWSMLQMVVENLLEAQIERGDLVIALGGGVIGDLAGFASAILRRGVRFVQIPTTLLAQVDSAVGGKTGINSPQGKNLIGAFHQPELVLSDIATLETLDQRQFLSGYGEVVKYACLGDANFFTTLETHAQEILGRDDAILEKIIAHSCQMKANIVTQDEKEHGVRALLNLGHTFGHALESTTGYGDRLYHGEAVAIGCGLAFDLSHDLGMTGSHEAKRLRTHLHDMGMKSHIHDIESYTVDVDTLMEAMRQDKKIQSGRFHLVLAQMIGHAKLVQDVDEAAIRHTLEKELHS